VGEPGLPDDSDSVPKGVFHCWQGPLLSLTFRPPSWPGSEVFSAYDLYLYYDPEHLLWYKRPDWFGVVGVPSLYQGKDLRQSYVVWQEQVTPVIAIEILSPSTEDEDLGKTKRKLNKPPTKWEVYEQILKIPNYVVYDENTRTLQSFQLTNGKYQPREISQTLVWIPQLELSLGPWHGFWNKSTEWWLRWYARDGVLILAPDEFQQQRADRLAAKLWELGLDPDQI
jgi:Uma2 family endonuclease